MRFKNIATMAVIATLALGGGTASTAFADSHGVMSAEDALAARKTTMRAQGGTMRTLGGLSGTDEMVEAARVYINTYVNLAAKFPEGSNIEGSKALPAIWEDWEGFTAIIAKGAGVASDMLIAAEAGDQAAFGAAAQQLGPVCGQCHGSYRAQ